MKVSLSRKIHIIALPQGTRLKASLSEAQSLAMPGQPGAASSAAVTLDSRGGGGCEAMFHLSPQKAAMAW
ncbi:hypothetical protein D9M71_302620 [compost metagenome]